VSSKNGAVQTGLADRRLGVGGIIFFLVSASAPITVLAGGVVATFAVTGSTGVALSFPILAAVLAVFAVGYTAMSRYVTNAGAFYAYLAQGIGRAWGVAGAFVAVLSYNAIQIALYGLFGFQVSLYVDRKFGLGWPWWAWALIACAVVGYLGLLRIDFSAKVIAVLLVLELAAVAVFDIGAFGDPAGGSVGFAALDPANLFTDTAGGVFAFGIAAFVGVEAAAIFSEEAKDPYKGVARATYASIAITGVFYTVSAWALTVGAGTSSVSTPHGPQPAVVAAAQDQQTNVVLALAARNLGGIVADVTSIVFITSVFAALVSFHQGVARYLFALGRERILPSWLGRTWHYTDSPVPGSVVHSLFAFVVVAMFAALHRSPMLELFPWMSYIAAVGILLLMVGTSVAVVGYFRQWDTEENFWRRVVAPVLGGVALVAVTVVTVLNADAVLGAARGSSLTWVLPGVAVLAGGLGLAWGRFLKIRRPRVYARIGTGG